MCSLNDSNSVDAGDVARNESLARLEIALLSVIFISAAILNTSLLLVLWRQRKQMSRMRILSSTCAWRIWWSLSSRYQAVCNPMVKFQRTSTKLNIPVCLAWGVSLLGSLPQVFIFAQVEVAPVRICRVIQINLYQKTQQQRNVGLPLPSRASGVAGMSKARVKTLKMTVAIVLAYIVCWAPFFTVQLWSAWDAHAPKETATFTILMLLASLNSCANPCIYLMFSGHLPKRLMRLLCHRQSDGRDSIHEATLVSTLYMNFKNVSELK
ncbi:Vasopressin V1b receptor [Dissostichus eleginoides]|uniref:Vasopressin V1b receptor n=1 Tax=Dissostichus eleginoides TaxID=100907 RepID=A0AAD9CHZ2_DISEL|nr:Vasopressin V1b receptor [Dissostichus eleginoides]